MSAKNGIESRDTLTFPKLMSIELLQYWDNCKLRYHTLHNSPDPTKLRFSQSGHKQ